MNAELDIDVARLLRRRRFDLEAHTEPGVLFETKAGRFHCSACAHRCVLVDGGSGVCGVRIRRGETLRVPFGYVARRHVRAVETNVLYHVRPGSLALTFGMYGCDLHCGYCQNWRLSQVARDPEAGGPVETISAAALAEAAVSAGCNVLCAAYNEPLISAEWTRAVFEAAKQRGLTTALVTDAHTTSEVLAYMRPVTDVFRADLKAYDAESYRALGGQLEPVVRAIDEAKRLGYWVEVATLVVPELNADRRGLRRLADLIRAIDPRIPWHLNAFQPRYRMQDRAAPSPAELWNFAASAHARGLEFVYVGNVVDPAFMTTRCPSCRTQVIERSDWQLTSSRLVDGACPHCATPLPGLW